MTNFITIKKFFTKDNILSIREPVTGTDTYNDTYSYPTPQNSTNDRTHHLISVLYGNRNLCQDHRPLAS